MELLRNPQTTKTPPRTLKPIRTTCIFVASQIDRIKRCMTARVRPMK